MTSWIWLVCHPTSMENTYSPLIGVFPSMPGAQKGGGRCGSDRAYVGDASHVTSGQATFGGCSAWPFLRVLWSSWTSRSSGPFDSLPVEDPMTLWRMPLNSVLCMRIQRLQYSIFLCLHRSRYASFFRQKSGCHPEGARMVSLIPEECDSARQSHRSKRQAIPSLTQRSRKVVIIVRISKITAIIPRMLFLVICTSLWYILILAHLSELPSAPPSARQSELQMAPLSICQSVGPL